MSSGFVYVGNWGFHAAPKGISIFSYNRDDGTMELLRSIRQDIAAGQLCLDEENNILYSVNEKGERDGEIGGGGYLYAFHIDPATGDLELFSQRESLLPEPSFLCMTEDKKYIMTCHCADPFHVTKLVRREDGSLGNEVLFDDTAVVLFPIEEDGSIGPACDAMVTEGTGGKGPRSSRTEDPVSHHIQLVEVISRLHSIYRSPGGKIFVTMDKGMDRVITFRVDEEEKRLVRLDTFEVEEAASFPRYGAFHPLLPLFYADNENLTLLNCFRYTEEGTLSLLYKLPLTFEKVGLIDGKPAGCQDILIRPDGKTLYVSMSGLNEIAAVHLDEDGRPSLMQQISTEGVFPRALQLDPESRYLYAGNMISGDIAQFSIEDDGTLQFTGRKFDAVSPSAIRFYHCS